ncbi:MAG TPA: VOC family protein [Verrucomicrobiales bacterium]|nr:VOC family protein [Verrucomicrobiales bacterium]
MSRPVHFEIHAEQPERAITFYTGLFGWKFSKWEGPAPYWLITTGPDSERGINGGLMPRRGDAPAAMQAVNAWICTVDVEDVDASAAKSVELGGVICVPKMPIPGVGWLAYSKDTEGNIFGMMQPDPNAK